MRFSHAIVRPPAATFAAGITTSGLGPPDLALALEQHEAYCQTLGRLGLSLVRLVPDAAFPDSTFVDEDAAIVTARGAMLLRPGAASRAGEVAALGAALDPWFPDLNAITAPGTVDGGRRLRGRPAFLHRALGADQRRGSGPGHRLARAARFRIERDRHQTDAPLLHLKTGLSWLGGRRLLAADEVAGHAALGGWEVVRVPDGEAYAANCLMINDVVALIAQGCPGTASLLGKLGYEVVALGMSEYRKMNGGLSCLSVRW